MTEIEIGKGKRGRMAYSFDDIAIVPSRRTRDPEEVSVAWQIDAYRFEIPVLAAPMDSVVSPATAIAIGQLGGVGVLDLEGLWTRYDDPEPLLAEIAGLEDAEVTRRMQEIYDAPVQPELVAARIAEVREARGDRGCGAVAAAHRAAVEDGRRRRRRPVRHPRYDGQSPSTSRAGPSRSTSSSSSTSSTYRSSSAAARPTRPRCT